MSTMSELDELKINESLFILNFILQVVSYLGLPPYIVLNPETGSPDGVDLRLLKVISGHFGFTYELKKENGWLYKDKDTGKLRGAIGNVRQYKITSLKPRIYDSIQGACTMAPPT